jgi:hypothetical protein
MWCFHFIELKGSFVHAGARRQWSWPSQHACKLSLPAGLVASLQSRMHRALSRTSQGTAARRGLPTFRSPYEVN